MFVKENPDRKKKKKKKLILKQVSFSSFQKNFVSKLKYISNAMKFDIKSRSSLLTMNMIFEIADLDPKLKAWADLV